MNLTLGIIKPGAVEKGLASFLLREIQQERGLEILSRRLVRFNGTQAREFYAEHEGKSFFGSLVDHTTKGPCMTLIIGTSYFGDNPYNFGLREVTTLWRDMIGSTDPSKARKGTLRHQYLTACKNLLDAQGRAVTNNPLEPADNGLHGSDSPESAAREIEFVLRHGLI